MFFNAIVIRYPKVDKKRRRYAAPAAQRFCINCPAPGHTTAESSIGTLDDRLAFIWVPIVHITCAPCRGGSAVLPYPSGVAFFQKSSLFVQCSIPFVRVLRIGSAERRRPFTQSFRFLLSLSAGCILISLFPLPLFFLLLFLSELFLTLIV